MKKIFLLILLTLMPMVTRAYDVQIDGIYYNLDASKKLAYVTYYYKNSSLNVKAYTGNIILPSEVTYNNVTYNVVYITEYSFWCCNKLNSIIIPNSVTYIDNYAFAGCSRLASIVIPNSVTDIGNHAFEDCSGLTSLTIGSGVKSIGSKAFLGTDFTDFYCYAETVPRIIDYSDNVPCIDAFGANLLEHATLHVPAASVNAYKSTAPWSGFKEILAIPGTETPTFKLTYIVDGIIYKTYDIEYGATITPETVPTKEGYTFSGWSEIPQTMPANDVTVTGTFTINKYKLIYKVDGVEYKTYDIEYGTTITPEAAPTKEGYTFSGWSEIPQTMPANDVTVTGTFTINKYKLTYRVDGKEYKTFEIEYGATITPEAAPTKEGYTFSGWSEIPSTMPANDVTVKGTFTINKYKLTYKVDGEVYKTYEMEYGTSITPEESPSKEGYTFSGWSWVPTKMPAEDVTITGYFTVNKYKLIYKVDGAEYKTYEIEYGASITPENDPTKEGYTFSGWTGLPDTMPASDVTITGSFTINKYQLTYIIDGEVYKSYEIKYGSTITPEAEPSKEGFTFSGWSDIPEEMPASDVTIFGSFTINQYTITYIIDGEVYLSETVDYNSAITPPTIPDKEGYDFAWSDYPETMPAHDITITGSYTMGISPIGMNSEGAKFFTIGGKQVEKIQKGVIIIKMNDGTTRKMFVK